MTDQPDIEMLIAQHLAGVPITGHDGASAPIGGSVVDWRTLPEDEAAETWKSLRTWVEWATIRYRIPVSVVPDCWYRHGDLVEELSALFAAHTAAFHPSDSGLGPISWHERLAVAVPRLTRAYGGGCSSGHRTFKPRAWSDVIDEQEWDTWVTATHAQ